MAIALYNKYRPQIFEDVVGQEQIARTLKNAIASNKTAHSYLFTGPRGTGKTTTARLFSKALLCQGGPTPDPDGSCEECELIARGEHPDVYELDAASRTGVENVREEIIGKVHYAPTRGRYKVYIIDEVHMLSTAAFNALLKTLEEPPSHVVFIMCTTDPQKIPETILSRCQRFDFRRISSEEMIARLGAICEMEGVEFEGDALDLIAHRAQGGMRDALTSLEQLIAFGDGCVSAEAAERMLGALDSSDLAEIVDAIGNRDAARCFKWTAEYMETGADLVQFVQDLTEHMRDMYVMSLAGADVALDITEAARRELVSELSMFGPDRIARALDVLNSLSMELKTSTNQRLSFEVSLTRLLRAESDITLAALAERVESLERALAGGAAQAVGNAHAGSVVVSSPSPAGSIADALQSAGSQPVGGAPRDNVASAATASTSADIARQAQPQAWQAGGSQSAAVRSHGVGSLGQTAEPSSQMQSRAASSAPAGSVASISDAGSFWDSVQVHLKKVGAPYAVIFMGTAASIDDGKLVIEFEAGKDFPFKAAQKPESRTALEEALSRAGHPGMEYGIVMGAPRSGASASSAAPCEQQVQAQPASFEQPQQSQEWQQSQVQQQLQQSQQQSQSQQPACSEPVAVQPAAAEQDSAASQSQAQSKQPSAADADFADFLTSAFGENIVIEEISE